MPKAPTDYSKTNIYKIVCNDLRVKDCYVGHTINMTKRKCGHKTRCNNEKNKNHNFKIYKIIRENGGWDNWNMLLVEKFPCKDKYEACKREREVYEELDAKLNTKRPYRTQEELKEDIKDYGKQYRQEHKAERKEKRKQYCEDHKEEIQQYQKEYDKQYREDHKEEIQQYSKQYREEHKEVIAENSKQYREEHKEVIAEKKKQYYQDHKKKIAEKQKEKNKAKIECEYCSKLLSKCSMSYHLKICKSKE